MGAEDNKIQKLREELDKTPSNKATQHHRGLLKAKIAALSETREKKASGTGAALGGYSVKKTGDATVVLIGFPSVGKSTLLNRITNANSEVGGYDFTTLDVIPGVLEYKGAKIQILDVPGIIEGAAEGKGRGREILSVISNSDLVIIMTDAFKIRHIDIIKKELYNGRIRLESKKPDVTIEKTGRGGITVNTAVKLKKIDARTVKSVLNGHRINNANIILRTDVTDDELTDAILGNRKYVPMMILVNKSEFLDEAGMDEIREKYKDDNILFISAEKGTNIEKLKDRTYDKLQFIQIYTKPVGKEIDMDEPLIMKTGCTVGDVCDKLHMSFRKRFKYARIFGKSAKFNGQRKNLGHVLVDGDAVELHL
ncbi:MAG: GTP-binding protein [Nanohaloarchaea archaeon]|nr:GTP-binding protein [Candidatus Nanohaloarchaea archaeon]